MFWKGNTAMDGLSGNGKFAGWLSERVAAPQRPQQDLEPLFRQGPQRERGSRQ
jgi:hypothetical protein